MIEKHAPILCVILVLIATARIVSTWQVFNVTIDEAAHIACGMEWLDKHTYKQEDQHPPLARAAVALGPYLLGIRSQQQPNTSQEGAEILKAQGKLDRNLKAARAGTLPFFWISCAAVFLCARKLLNPICCTAAVLLWTNLPPVLAHASLATTDMAMTAMLGCAGLAAVNLFESPSLDRAINLGIFAALAMLCKFSSIPFLVFSLLALFLWHPKLLLQLRVRQISYLLPALASFSLIIWATYHFSFGPVSKFGFNLPAPEFFNGLISVKEHNEQGHMAYLLGAFSNFGFPSYYPVVLLVKTPLPFLGLILIGACICLYEWKQAARYGYPLVFSIGILVFATLFSHINIGVRHVLPIYLGFSVVAAFGMQRMLATQKSALLASMLSIWVVGSSAKAHPDYLAYFNEAAGNEPERILIDSDLDWGQDMKRLAVRLQQLNVSEFTYLPLIYLELAGVEFPSVRVMDMEHVSPGWHAAHITALKLQQHEILLKNPKAKFWTNELAPLERIGRGILLWHI